MTEKEKSKNGYLYNPYEADLSADRDRCQELCFEYNSIRPTNLKEQRKIIRKLINDPNDTAILTAPFMCDYGYNITVGKNFYCNRYTVILDEANVIFGDNVLIGPHCTISTAGHPIDAEQRNSGIEIAFPITIENNVWIGANVTILPGVTIGSNSIIGAGGVVNKSIPDNVVAAGNPCKIIRTITEKDKDKYKFFHETV